MSSISIRKSNVTLEGLNCGQSSKSAEPGHSIGWGSLIYFSESCDGIRVIAHNADIEGRLGGITFRDFGIAGSGKSNGKTALMVAKTGTTGFGTTDALLIERLYIIEFETAVSLFSVDATILSNCWFSECGNGVNIQGAVYTSMTNCMFADNDNIGVHIA